MLLYLEKWKGRYYGIYLVLVYVRKRRDVPLDKNDKNCALVLDKLGSSKDLTLRKFKFLQDF